MRPGGGCRISSLPCLSLTTPFFSAHSRCHLLLSSPQLWKPDITPLKTQGCSRSLSLHSLLCLGTVVTHGCQDDIALCMKLLTIRSQYLGLSDGRCAGQGNFVPSLSNDRKFSPSADLVKEPELLELRGSKMERG